MEPEVLVLLVLAGLVAGFLDSIVGGGGVITLPALLAAGLPPHLAVGTNKVVGTGASSIATWNYARAGLLRRRLAWSLFPLSLVAAMVGAAAVLRLRGEFILAAVMVVMVVLTTYILLRPRFGAVDRTDLSGGTVLALAAMALAAGFYDGLLGPGTGNLLLFGFVAIAGMPFLRAAAHGRVLNFGSNVGALALFAWAGSVDWVVGPVMAVGTVTGAYLGSRSNIRAGAAWVRPLFVVVTLALFVRLAATYLTT